MKWVNPTGGKVRGQDVMGSGSFGAPRGSRKHMGADFTGVPGQDVLSVCDMVISKVGYCYGDELTFRYIAGLTDEGHLVRHLYVKPFPGMVSGRRVSAGEGIGTLQALHGRYPGITNHVHVDIKKDEEYLNPEGLIR